MQLSTVYPVIYSVRPRAWISPPTCDAEIVINFGYPNPLVSLPPPKGAEIFGRKNRGFGKKKEIFCQPGKKEIEILQKKKLYRRVPTRRALCRRIGP